MSSAKLIQRAHDAITMSLLRQNEVATLFWRNNDVIIASSCAHWEQITNTNEHDENIWSIFKLIIGVRYLQYLYYDLNDFHDEIK